MVDGAASERGVLERWFAIEMMRVSQGFVARPRAVAELAAEVAPTAPTRGGEVHRYDAGTIRRIHDALTPLQRRRVKLPATFHVDHETPSDAHVADEPSIELLKAIGEIPADTAPREGRVWLGLARARRIADRHPSAFQFAYR